MVKRRKVAKTTPESLQAEVDYLKKHLDKLWEHAQDAAERLQDVEVHVVLLTRLVTALCVEKMGMRVGVLKRMIRKIEKEVISEAQVNHLESLYNLPSLPGKKGHPARPKSEDHWEDIS